MLSLFLRESLFGWSCFSRKISLLRPFTDSCFRSKRVVGEINNLMARLSSCCFVRYALIRLMMERNVLWMNRRMKLNRTFWLLPFLNGVSRHRSKVYLMSNSWRGALNNYSVKEISIIMSLLSSISLELIYLSVVHAVKHFIMSNWICCLKVLFSEISKHNFWRIVSSSSLFPDFPSFCSSSLLINPLLPS